MKKTMLLLFVLTFFTNGCSDKEDIEFASIKINSVEFKVGENNSEINYVTTTFESEVNSGQANFRRFILKSKPENNSIPQTIQIDVYYPTGQLKIDGNYPLSSTVGDLNNYASCKLLSLTSFFSDSGLLIIKDLGNNKFRIGFSNNVKLVNYDPIFLDKTINGYYVGTFTAL